MKILVGCKLIPEDQDIIIKSDGSLDMSKATPKISQFDLNAIETAVEIKKSNPETNISAISIGGKCLDNVKARKDMLSRGPDELIIVSDEKYENILPHETAKIFANTVKDMDFDLILCGDGSGDIYAQQTGLRLGAILDLPTVNAVSKIISVDPQKVVVERALENEVEVLEIPLPAVISVSADINQPTIPGMKAIISAGKKPVNTVTNEEEIPCLVELVDVKAPKKKERQHVIIEGDSDDKITEFISHLRKII